MPFAIVRDDITRVKADAIVNAANEGLCQGGGVCGAIFAAAGARKLQRACDKIGHCDTGSAVATPGFRLPARYVIHTVGPIWRGGAAGEPELLASCYRRSLELAGELGCRSIAFPLISAGIYGYPRRQAIEVATREIRAYLDTHEMDVRLVLFDARVMELADDLQLRVQRYIDDVYAREHGSLERPTWEQRQISQVVEAEESQPEDASPYEGYAFGESALDEFDTAAPSSTGALFSASAAPAPQRTAAPQAAPRTSGPLPSAPSAAPSAAPARTGTSRLPRQLRSMLNHLDAGFSETLLRLIDERGLSDAQVYKRANISRQHFSKMRSNPRYRPTKQTVLALAIALELPLDETQMLLERAGFALSHADRRDIIVEYFIREGSYDIFRINETLFAFDQPLLG